MSGIQLPEFCGAILLPDTVLFPHGALPLHIFEDRYQEMLDDSLNTNCMICVGTLLDDENEDPSSCVHPIGTVGLIRASREMDDGRSNLILHGVHRVRFSSWPGGKNYPYAQTLPMTADPFPSDEGPLMASRLRDKINATLSGLPAEVKKEINEVLDRASDEPTVLLDVVAQQFVQDTQTRLQLLSEPSLDARYDLLTRHLTVIQKKLSQN